jgi:hypothetical protein
MRIKGFTRIKSYPIDYKIYPLHCLNKSYAELFSLLPDDFFCLKKAGCKGTVECKVLVNPFSYWFRDIPFVERGRFLAKISI